MSPAEATRNPRILLLTAEPGLGEELRIFLDANGYRTVLATDPESAGEARIGTAAAIVDIDGTDPAALAALAGPGPLLVLSSSDDVRTQLLAIRAGSAASFAKPPDFPDLLEALQGLLAPPELAPYRVLVVEDSRTMLAFITATLEAAGMVCRSVLNPLEALEVLPDFLPDLVLTDMYMPQCSGIELAALIRRNQAHLGIPIVYLSSETDTGKQLQALRTGGDDFLTKPIQPAHLVSSVQIRAERTRLLRNQMVKDSLTGLLNHVALKERLGAEVSRARRSGVPLCFAMLDLDHFKSVNDRHGHPVGDRVILALARLLQRRLRRSDVVGRYGGEEFGVVLPETGLDDAMDLLDRLRVDFSRLPHHGAAAFTATFSAGVALLGEHRDGAALCEAADAALYRAKAEGRNRLAAG